MAKVKWMPPGTFMKLFATEKQCRECLASQRWEAGFVCPKCAGRHAYVLSNGLYQCAECHHQTSVTAGTLLHKSHVPLTKWFLAFYFVCQDKRGISAVQLSFRIGVTYKMAWRMLDLIRTAMGRRDKKYKLNGAVELDDTYFGGPTRGKKRGRGTEKIKAFVALSLNESGDPCYLKMRVTKDLRQVSVRSFAEDTIDAKSTIRSDGYRSYIPALEGYTHEHRPYDPQTGMLHWLHIMVSNAKAYILGMYHGLPEQNLQSYLDEFCYRFNRRNFGEGALKRLVAAVVG